MNSKSAYKSFAPIVILHGWGLSGEKFTLLKDEFTRVGYAVFAPDLPGFGKSAVPAKPFHLSDYAEFLHAFMQKNSIVNPILIGHSFGGRVSLKYQMLYPKTIRALILTGTPGYTPVSKKRLVIFITLAKLGKFFLSIPPFHILKDGIRKWYYYVAGARDFYRAEGVMRDVFKNIVQEELVSSMKAVSVPCALVWGALDRITPLWIAERMQGTITGSRLMVIPDCDHGVSYKEPHLFVQTIESFLKTL